jgi:hypothetical protein
MTTKTPTKKFSYLRIPLDDNLSSDLQSIMDNNPYFNRVDAAKFAIGKYISQGFESSTPPSNANVNRLKANNSKIQPQDITNFLQNNPEAKVEFDAFEDLNQVFQK